MTKTKISPVNSEQKMMAYNSFLFVASVTKKNCKPVKARDGGEMITKLVFYLYSFFGKQTGGSIPLWTKRGLWKITLSLGA